MKGYINSIETAGMVDGPGVRFVVFLKGCKLKCLYCHNPESWFFEDGLIMTSNELLKKINNYHHYYKEGGVTFSGGDPLFQSDFLIDILKKCKKINIHTALDTSGVGVGKYEEILEYTDLVILDIKSYDEKQYQEITGQKIDEFNKFLQVAQKMNKELWIRQVIIPGINDTKQYVEGLKEYLKEIKNISNIELLPYSSLGEDKYSKLNLNYPLKGLASMSNKEIDKLKKILD